MSDQIKTAALEWINENASLIADAHQRAWELAEVGLLEQETGKFLADILEANGFTVERGLPECPRHSWRPMGQVAPRLA